MMTTIRSLVEDILMLGVILAVGYVVPAHAEVVSATVTSVERIERQIRLPMTTRTCWDEPAGVYYKEESYTPTIAGAILGGVIGNQFGSGSGKDVMTAAGVLLGGSIGNDHRGYTKHYSGTRTVCKDAPRTHYRYKRVTEGYEVHYDYEGITGYFVTDKRYRVGSTIAVDITPVVIE